MRSCRNRRPVGFKNSFSNDFPRRGSRFDPQIRDFTFQFATSASPRFPFVSSFHFSQRASEKSPQDFSALSRCRVPSLSVSARIRAMKWRPQCAGPERANDETNKISTCARSRSQRHASPLPAHSGNFVASKFLCGGKSGAYVERVPCVELWGTVCEVEFRRSLAYLIRRQCGGGSSKLLLPGDGGA